MTEDEYLPPPQTRYIPRCMQYDNLQASGLAMDISARATITMSSLFLGPALLALADQEVAACGYLCHGRVYGFRPTSLLTNIATISSLLVSVTLPLVGAVVDHSPYRKQVGAYTAAGMVICKMIEFSVGPSTWFFVSVLQIVFLVLFSFHMTAIYAYTADLSADVSKQTWYNTSFYVLMYASTLLFLATVLSIVSWKNLDTVGTARVSLALTSIISIICFSFAWTHLFTDRAPLRAVPPGMTLWTCGFLKVWNTTQRIATHYPALVWLMIAIAFGEAAASALIATSTTYMASVLKMEGSEVGIVFFTVLVCGIPGSKMADLLASRKWSPTHSLLICNGLFICATILASLVLRGPEDKNKVYFFASAWGIGLGWLHPVELSAFISLVEKGQEAEMMGIFLLVGQILTWLPPLIFTLLSESGVSLGVGLASLAVFFFCAVLALCGMGNYEAALRTLRERQNEEQIHGSELPSYDALAVESEDIPVSFAHLA
ncbi:hypothetical protein FisN_28Lh018 [Fistulifera solaris]|uniref:Major facilitator superfamily (MFS) profile domain-containing protein n=1 Tax=Fistulifera solaris TaxID=1519565 RepID=A0A1Z5KS88_FISSO|nr:hypothetical protein FisN_28Lh018 [Fistulifera solaris]|eukprot:GAX29190.1 hypothetical protein FisN_28Lh018 [Fistulifera solaris]